MIRVEVPTELRYYSDCHRIVQIFKDRGMICTPSQAQAIWNGFSESMAAGWMSLDNDDDVVFSNCLGHYAEIDDGVPSID